MKHTKGPWHTTGKSFNDQPQISEEKTGRTIALCYSLGQPDGHSLGKPNRETTEAEANAHLITAAPELLEVCKAAYDILAQLHYNDISVSYDKELNQLEGAINKAGGN